MVTELLKDWKKTKIHSTLKIILFYCKYIHIYIIIILSLLLLNIIYYI